MPKVPQPAKTPESISPTLWNGENREDILAFLGDLNGAYLFYQVMKGDPDPKISAIDEANAAKVDKITNLQKAQYLSQADSMYLNEKTKSPVKKAPEIGDEEAIQQAFDGASDNINFYKIPAGVYGHKDLQKGLYMLLRSMAKANYSTTIGGVSSLLVFISEKTQLNRICICSHDHRTACVHSGTLRTHGGALRLRRHCTHGPGCPFPSER